MNKQCWHGPEMQHSNSYLRIEPTHSGPSARPVTPEPLQKPATPGLINILSRPMLENYLRDHSITSISPKAFIDKVKVTAERKRSGRAAHERFLTRLAQHRSSHSKLSYDQAKRVQASHMILQSIDPLARRRPKHFKYFPQ